MMTVFFTFLAIYISILFYGVYMYVLRSCVCLVVVMSCTFETTFKELAARRCLLCNTYLVQIVIVYSMC